MRSTSCARVASCQRAWGNPHWKTSAAMGAGPPPWTAVTMSSSLPRYLCHTRRQRFADASPLRVIVVRMAFDAFGFQPLHFPLLGDQKHYVRGYKSRFQAVDYWGKQKKS